VTSHPCHLLYPPSQDFFSLFLILLYFVDALRVLYCMCIRAHKGWPKNDDFCNNKFYVRRLRCGGIFSDSIILKNSPDSDTEKKIKLVNIL